MTLEASLFPHALARFRSAIPIGQADAWNQRHSYDLAVSFRKLFWTLDGELPDLAIVWRSGLSGRTPSHVCISGFGQLIDLFGTNVLPRLEEADFEDGVLYKAETFDCHEALSQVLEGADYYVDYWPAPADLAESLHSGILAAAGELAPSPLLPTP